MTAVSAPISSLRWRRNLYVCCAGSFTTIVAMTLLLPYLPLYVQELGVSDPGEIALFSGLAYSATWLTAALTAPLWGKLGDRYGRKSMLIRASLGMAVAISLIGFAQNVWQLVVLRLLVGLVGGYASGSTILVAAQAPKERSAWALGMISAGIMAGSIAGPLLGGVMPALIGARATFLFSGGLIFLAFLATLFWLTEDRGAVREVAARKAAAGKGSGAGVWSGIAHKGTVVALLGLLVLLTLSTLSIEPIVTVYVQDLAEQSGASVNIAIVSGVIFALSAAGTIISAPRLGKLADRVGYLRVVTISLLVTAALLALQGLAVDLWQLGVLRFLTGVALGGLVPCVTASIRHRVPGAVVGAILGLGVSAQYLGQVAGPLLGAVVAGTWGIPAVFYATAAVALIGAGVSWRIGRYTVTSSLATESSDPGTNE